VRRGSILGLIIALLTLSGVYLVGKDLVSIIRKSFSSPEEELRKKTEQKKVGVVAVCKTPLYIGLSINKDTTVSGTVRVAKTDSGEDRIAYLGKKFMALDPDLKISYTRQGEVLIPILFPDAQGKFLMSEGVWWIMYTDTTLSGKVEQSPGSCAGVVKKESEQEQAAAISELNISATSLRFFEGGPGGLDYGFKPDKQEYGFRLPQSRARYIYYVLNLGHRKTGRSYGVKVPIKIIWYRPPANSSEDEIMTQSIEAYVDPSWASSYQAGYHGTRDAVWAWGVGAYKVVAYINGKKAITRSFEIYNDTSSDSQVADSDGQVTETFVPVLTDKEISLADLNVSVVALNFYESSTEAIPKDKRDYKTRFSQSKTRYINWELNLKYPNSKKRIEFLISSSLHKDSGSPIQQNTTNNIIQEGWNWSYYSHGWGDNRFGHYWKVGTYTATLYIGQKKVASGSFEVY